MKKINERLKSVSLRDPKMLLRYGRGLNDELQLQEVEFGIEDLRDVKGLINLLPILKKLELKPRVKKRTKQQQGYTS